MRIELYILIGVAVLALVGVLMILVRKKKKKSKKAEPAPEDKKPKIEPVYKKAEEPEQKKEEAKEEKPLSNEQKEQVKQAGFKIIRKKSQVKINKKALQSGSRNPSITRVFVDGKNVEEEEKKSAMPDITTEKPEVTKDNEEDVGRFGARQISYQDEVNNKEFRMKNPDGAPNRAPILMDRTNFGSHLVVRDDNNLSGVAGTGVAKVVEKTNERTADIDRKTDEMIEKVKMSILGQRNSDPLSFFGQEEDNPDKAKQKIDAKTIIIGEAVSKRKGNLSNF